MSKRITNIKIRNCGAYFDEYSIPLNSGQNLFIYGENGSGKSSLYKALNSFFRNSVSTQEFTKNLFNNNNDGIVEIEFSDFLEIKGPNSESYCFSQNVSNNEVAFIKDASLLNGFLDYTDLLKIYLKSDPNPNLFELIILNLLREFIPVSSASSISIGDQYDSLIRDLITNTRNTMSRCHKSGLLRIEEFDLSLRTLLDNIFILVNVYIREYFFLNDIEIEYNLEKIEFFYPSNKKSTWFLKTDLRLKILKNGTELGGEYKNFLNEARLSSVAICLYLASLKLFPNEVDLKLIYLDDIFIGLDTSNRIPILNILNEQFSDYQIVISTYDRSFFEACIRKLSKTGQWDWKPIELYVGETDHNNAKIEVPILISSDSDLEKARYFLYNNQKPDYPAAANYFRKYLEHRLLEVFPDEIFREDNLQIIDSYKLSKTFNACKKLLLQTGIVISEFENLQSYLFLLLHPLSHHNTSSNTYKRDLKEIDNYIFNLLERPGKLGFIKYLRHFAKDTTIRIEFFINQYNIWFYEFYIKDCLFYNLETGLFSEVELICTKLYSIKNKVNQKVIDLNKGTSNIKYRSIVEAFEEIGKIISNSYRFYKFNFDYVKYVSIYDGTNWVLFDKTLKASGLSQKVKRMPVVEPLPDKKAEMLKSS
ncbi:ATP-binding protein [Sphingobacterium multivorum]|uniref:ATP-binding protein n=1 Tax=Sphingobacterium multivorum TaxID=28454 RepID=A0ABX7CTE1_SPHMU|nr:ATP-binding protein [Sphingobacterium multivorum]QQT55346.1 ATP-binding protein [Sphingobacterium multivorum]